jgi:WD40-like Beta Propeller Repeat
MASSSRRADHATDSRKGHSATKPEAGTQIVFEHFGSLYTIHPDGTSLVKIHLQTGRTTTSFGAFDAGWSPDGTKLVFSLRAHAGDGTVQEGIGKANADGSDVQMITTSPTRDATGDWGPLAT